jgi:transcriptional regulator
VYAPAAFREDRAEILHEAIRRMKFGSLVTSGAAPGDPPEASHVPMQLDLTQGPHGVLLGHLAKPNPQAGLRGPALATFVGADAYISPAAYAAKRETGKVVPTWNYLAVHAAGTLEPIDDAAELTALVASLTDAHEATQAQPWKVTDAPPPYIASMVRGIVGFRLVIARLEGKWKFSQNRPEGDRAAIVAALRATAPEAAAMVEATLGK